MLVAAISRAGAGQARGTAHRELPAVPPDAAKHDPVVLVALRLILDILLEMFLVLTQTILLLLLFLLLPSILFL